MWTSDKLILAIETSCDETALAIVDAIGNIICQKLFSQVEVHSLYGGVVPEIAARNHLQVIHRLFYELIDEYETNGNICSADSIDAVAVTAGPGLIGGVIVGVMFAKGLAAALKKPCIVVNHLVGHALAARMTEKEIKFPYLLLLISGGHCQLLVVEHPVKYIILGQTRDDAVGEVFDKVAKMLDLGYPGGPIIERYAKSGDRKAIVLPKPLVGCDGCEFSFSGLKTAIFRHVQAAKNNKLFCKQFVQDMCASFQHTVAEILSDRVINAIEMCRNNEDKQTKHCEYGINSIIDSVVISGGVSANRYICEFLRSTVNNFGMHFFAPPVKLCTDNAAMIAWAAHEIIKFDPTVLIRSSLDFIPRSRWSIENL